MKRKILLIGIVIALVLTGCAPAFVAGTTTVPTGTTQETATAPTTEATTQPSTEPSTVPEETTVPADETLPRRFVRDTYPSGDLYSFVYRGKEPFDSMKFDTSTCVVGSLYEYNKSEDTLRLIANGPVCENMYTDTRFYYYYVLESDPTVIMRADRNGEEHAVFYTSELGAVNSMYYYGYDDNGFLLLVLGNKYIVRYSIPAMTTDLLYEGDGITCAFASISGTYVEGREIFYPDGSEPIIISGIQFGKSETSGWATSWWGYTRGTGIVRPLP